MRGGSDRTQSDDVIGHLTGTVLRSGVIDCGGVGWAVAYPETLEPGSEVSLFVTSVWARDGGLSLYGFTSVDSQAVFEALCRVSRVGPAVALALLRAHGASGVVSLVAARDPAGLAKAPGVGRKTADMVVSMVELPEIEIELEAAGPAISVRKALVGLGFDERAATEAVGAAIAAGADSGDEPGLLRAALAAARGGS